MFRRLIVFIVPSMVFLIILIKATKHFQFIVSSELANAVILSWKVPDPTYPTKYQALVRFYNAKKGDSSTASLEVTSEKPPRKLLPIRYDSTQVTIFRPESVEWRRVTSLVFGCILMLTLMVITGRELVSFIILKKFK